MNLRGAFKVGQIVYVRQGYNKDNYYGKILDITDTEAEVGSYHEAVAGNGVWHPLEELSVEELFSLNALEKAILDGVNSNA